MSIVSTLVDRLLGREDDEVGPPAKYAEKYPTDEEGVPIVPEDDVVGVFPRDHAFGHNIDWRNFEDRTVVGWIGGLTSSAGYASPGDLFGYEMESDRVAVFELVAVDRQTDPADMFFADARDVGYLEQPEGDNE